MGFIYLPRPALEIVGAYSTGLARHFGSSVGFFMLTVSVFLFASYLTSLAYGFLYRVLSLKDHGLMRTLHSKKGKIIVFFVHILIGSLFSYPVQFCHLDDDLYKFLVLQDHPQYQTFFKEHPMFGSNYKYKPIIFAASVINAYLVSWLFFIVFCLVAFLRHLRAAKFTMKNKAYKLQVNLFRALAVQTFAPIILLCVPFTMVFLGFIFRFPFHNSKTKHKLNNTMDGILVIVELTEVVYTFHSIINGLVVIFMIPAYRKVVIGSYQKLIVEIGIHKVIKSISNETGMTATKVQTISVRNTTLCSDRVFAKRF
ncbi:hypothetical protein L596_030086 [Steinernema carpocapsae]|uniref:G-protein coupled receptors family 1 profile domain-containing protein n=1 Tax=Steinernema carpocapsae TaxID=34508 RepID=A0A4U5LRP5_STECR|nr:hypothetical protein L596_030086 [Steinernema carpocapsae]